LCLYLPGELEVEITYGGEADLHKHFKQCKKNPGHKKFIPVDQFNVDHLPADCRDEDLVELVRALSDLTVRVSAKYVSDKRPATIPGSNEPYPHYKFRGKNLTRVGTGLVYFIDKYPDEFGRYTSCFCEECVLATTSKVCKCEECLESDPPTTCQCHKCLVSGNPKTTFAHIVMLTAVHVVYDSLEGAQTTCHLFFDNGTTPDKCDSAVTLQGMFRVRSFDNRDWCEMTFVTHDMEFAERLEKMYERWEIIRDKIEDKYKPLLDENKPSTSSAEPVPEELKTLTLLVSHPHGCSKQVSVGSFTDREVKVFDVKVKSDLARYTYTTPSCRGSSGGPVFILARSWCGLYDTHVHSGGIVSATRSDSSPADGQLNYSCFGSEDTPKVEN
jgi:hypothetical protein